MLEYSIFDTIIGPIGVVASPRGLKKVELRCPPSDLFKKKLEDEYKNEMRENNENTLLKKAHSQINKYLSRQLKKFDLPIDISVSPFVEKVLLIVSKIPYGKIASYREIAKKANSEKSARAVGRAMSANPLPIIIPCHRVITSEQTLGGYSAGLDIKAFLLSMEAKENTVKKTF